MNFAPTVITETQAFIHNERYQVVLTSKNNILKFIRFLHILPKYNHLKFHKLHWTLNDYHINLSEQRHTYWKFQRQISAIHLFLTDFNTLE